MFLQSFPVCAIFLFRLIFSPIMKKICSVLISLLLTIFFGCSKDDDSYSWGKVFFKNNGTYWENKSEIYAIENQPYQQGIDIIARRYNAAGFNREVFSIYKIPAAVGKVDIVDTGNRDIDDLTGASYTTLIDDGHVIGDFYKLLEAGHENYVEIEKINGKEIWGTFEVAFVKDIIGAIEGDPMAPDTVIITDGEFHTRIVD